MRACDSKQYNYKHYILGLPRINGGSNKHYFLRKYRHFTLLYDQRILAPRWAVMKLPVKNYNRNSRLKHRLSKFYPDYILWKNRLNVTFHNEYNNIDSKNIIWDRGHMIRYADAVKYDDCGALQSMYTSNMCPQLKLLNRKAWKQLEIDMANFTKKHRNVWIIVGPIYNQNSKAFIPGRRIPSPVAFFRIAIARIKKENYKAIAFIMPHKPIRQNVDMKKFVTTIDTIESLTGFDFFHLLNDDVESTLESQKDMSLLEN